MFRFLDEVLFPTRAATVAVLSAYLANNAPANKPDIWLARDASIEGRPGLTPVVLGIWDGGSDTSLFPEQLYTDPHPSEYDEHGLSFDLDGFKTHGDLFPLDAAHAREYPAMIADLKGFGDIEAGVDSLEAAAVKRKFFTMTPTQSAAYLEEVELFQGTYSHGTHVAGIALRDNPAARLLVGRMTYNYKAIPPAPTDALVARLDRNIIDFVVYFKAHEARVVNMSFYETAAEYEHDLEANGLGKDAERRSRSAGTHSIRRPITMPSRAHPRFFSYRAPGTPTTTRPSTISFRLRSIYRTF